MGSTVRLGSNATDPLYVKNWDIQNGIGLDQNGSNVRINSYEICDAASKVVSSRNIEGAQMIKGVWHIYTKTVTSRIELLTNGFVIRGTNVSIFDSNPYKKMNDDTPVEKILIKDIPLHVENKIIENHLKNHEGLLLKSDIKYAKARDSNGKLSNFKNGDRFCYALAPIIPALPRNEVIEGFPCKIFHQSQEEECKICETTGHKMGSPNCPAYNDDFDRIVAFRSYMNIFSNDFPCKIKYENELYRSVEHAYQSIKAKSLGQNDLAYEIKEAMHAGAARAKARNKLDEKDSSEWEKKSENVMRELITTKAEMNEDFKAALLDTGDCIIAEATGHKIWASGLDVFMTQRTDPSYWPGQNLLGRIMMSLRDQIKGVSNTEGETVNENESSTTKTYENVLDETQSDGEVSLNANNDLLDDTLTDIDTQSDILIPENSDKDDSIGQNEIASVMSKNGDMGDITVDKGHGKKEGQSLLKALSVKVGQKVNSIKNNTLDNFVVKQKKRNPSQSPPQSKSIKKAKQSDEHKQHTCPEMYTVKEVDIQSSTGTSYNGHSPT